MKIHGSDSTENGKFSMIAATAMSCSLNELRYPGYWPSIPPLVRYFFLCMEFLCNDTIKNAVSLQIQRKIIVQHWFTQCGEEAFREVITATP